MLEVFVYGTLKPGERNYAVCAAEVIAVRPAIAFGQLFHLPLGYPAMTPGTAAIRGFVLSFDDPAMLEILDQFEQHDPVVLSQIAPKVPLQQCQYDRQLVQTFDPDDRNPLGQAWVYRMSFQQVESLSGVCVIQHCWSEKDWF
jgi:gamma-glutamylcyclotransferase (GGCT)/AIG2-like uncharacterized protein YtfP